MKVRTRTSTGSPIRTVAGEADTTTSPAAETADAIAMLAIKAPISRTSLGLTTGTLHR
jgi:hypothetical protein